MGYKMFEFTASQKTINSRVIMSKIILLIKIYHMTNYLMLVQKIILYFEYLQQNPKRAGRMERNPSERVRRGCSNKQHSSDLAFSVDRSSTGE